MKSNYRVKSYDIWILKLSILVSVKFFFFFFFFGGGGVACITDELNPDRGRI